MTAKSETDLAGSALGSASATTAPRKPSIVGLILISALGPLALNMFMPSMPGMQAVFNTDYATIQLTLTLYLVAIGFSQIVFGTLSDRYGRRPVLLCGLALFLGGTLICAAAPTIEILILGRMLQGAGGAVGLALGRAMVRDVYDTRRSASMIGYVTMAMVVAPMFGPLIGGLLDVRFGWQAGFLLLLVLGTGVTAYIWATLPETNLKLSTEGFGPLARSAGTLVRMPAFLGYAGALSFASASFFAFLAGAPYVVVEVMGHPPSVYGAYFMMGAFGYMSGNFLSGRFSERFGADRMIAAGNGVGILGASILLANLVFTELSLLGLFIPMAILALSNGMVLPNATAKAISVRPDLAGSAAGICGAAQLGIGALATVIVGALLVDNAWPMALVMATAVTVSIAASTLGRRSFIDAD
ncbi:MAG: multidrug effflux MFS transporter [Pseudomonadota bacterium]